MLTRRIWAAGVSSHHPDHRHPGCGDPLRASVHRFGERVRGAGLGLAGDSLIESSTSIGFRSSVRRIGATI